MSPILFGLAVVPLAAIMLWLIYDRRFSPRGVKRLQERRELEKRGAAARLDLLNKATESPASDARVGLPDGEDLR